MLNIAELTVVLITIMLVLGIGRLPQLGEAFGRAHRNYKRSREGRADLDITPQTQLDANASPTTPQTDIEDAEIIE